MGITDIDDKIIKTAYELRISSVDLANFHSKDFANTLMKLGILLPTRFSRVTENIDEIIRIVEALLAKGWAYQTNTGVYFSVEKLTLNGSYPRFKCTVQSNELADVDLGKKDSRDFCLWKLKEQQEDSASWSSPFGRGRPGWHIECSANGKAEIEIFIILNLQ